MEWTYNPTKKEHQLIYNASELVRIQLVPRKTGGFAVKTLISIIYFGTRKQKKWEHQSKEWVASRKDFQKWEEVEQYLERKKKAVEKFINAREKEA